MSENGNCPPDWREASISDLCSPQPHSLKRGPFGSVIRKDCFVPSGYKVYEQQHAIKEDFSLGTYYVDKAKFDELSAFRVAPGDLLISCAGTIGRIAVVPDWAEPGIINQALLKITLKPDVVDRKYFVHLFRFLSSKISARGTGMQNLAGVKELKKVRFPLPPLPEQRRIVAEIEKQFTRLEAGVAALRRVQANLKRYRAAVLKAACEGKLVPTEAELQKGGSGVPPLAPTHKNKRRDAASTLSLETGEALLARILTERRQNWQGRGQYKEPAVPDTTDLPQLPEGWIWASLDQLLGLMRNGISAKPNAKSGLPILRISAVRALSVNVAEARYLSAGANDYLDYALTEGDLLFTRYNGNPELVGVCGVVPLLTSPLVHPDKLIRCKLISTGALPDFVAIMANVGASREYLAKRVRTTAGQAGISGGDLKGLPIQLAPLAEQTRIVAEVERRLSVVEELEAVVSANLQRATRLRQSILHNAFAGKL